MQRSRNQATRRTGRPRTAALAGTAGLLLAATLVSGAPPDGPGDRSAAAEPVAGQAAAPRAPAPLPADAVEPETCWEGDDPTVSLTPSDEAGFAVRRVVDAGELVVGVDQNSYLWGFRDPATDALTGFDIDLVYAIAEDLLGEDPDVVFRAVPTAELIPMVRDGELDMGVRTASITCDRLRQVSFSAPYFETGQQLLAPRGSDIEGFDRSLRQARVCAGEDTTAEELLSDTARQYRAEPVTADDHLDCLVLLQQGEVDALVTDGALAAGHAAQDPAVHLVGELMTAESYGVVMNQDDEDLVRRVNAVLADYTDGGEDSAWRQAYDRWLAEHMETAEPSPPDPLYRD